MLLSFNAFERQPMLSYWILSESKFFQVSRTLLSILADLKNAIIWMISTSPLISKSSSPFTNPSRIVQNVPITIGITVTFMFHSFFLVPKQSPGTYFIFQIFVFFQFYSVVCWYSKFNNSAGSLFLLTITRAGHLAEIRGSVYISKLQRNLRVPFCWKYSVFWLYNLFVWSNLDFLHNSQSIALPTQLCLVLYSFCADLLHSLIR